MAFNEGMNYMSKYYNKIKNELINNEIYKKAKDYSKNRNDLNTYFNVGKLLNDAGKCYGKNIIKEYSIKLTNDLGKQYSYRTLNYMIKFYKFQKMQSVTANLSWGHWIELLSIKDYNKVLYYVNQVELLLLTTRQLREKIKNHEYERLPIETKNKLIHNKNTKIQDYIKNPIIINSNGKDIVNEKMLKLLILENIEIFLKELGNGFCYIDNEYKIKIGSNYNYIDLLLFNHIYNCFVVIELKTIELKKEHLGQIQVYMNYVDEHLKSINQDKTIGIIISKEDNKYLIKYCSDDRVFNTKYITI